MTAQLPTKWSLKATLFDGQTSRPYPAHVWLEGSQLYIKILETERTRQWKMPVQHLVIEPPLAGTARILALRQTQMVGLTNTPLGSGARLECGPETYAQVVVLEQALRRNRLPRLVAALEQRWGGVLLALLLLGGFGYGFINAGLPLVARQAALMTSVKALQKLDNETVHYLQTSQVLKPSTLSQSRQAQIRRSFMGLVHERGGQYHYRLLFRHGGPMKANAFALPAGTVVITDELIALAHSEREIDGVLVHELSHVTHRDALTQIYQALGLSLLVGAITGDLVGPTTTAAAIPTFLLQSRYSRQMESVADHFAGEYLLQHYATTKPLQDMLSRLESADSSTAPTATAHKNQTSNKHKPDTTKPKTNPKAKPKTDTAWLENWLGNHPVTTQRIADLQQQELAWKASK